MEYKKHAEEDVKPVNTKTCTKVTPNYLVFSPWTPRLLQHFLYISAMEPLINYCIFKTLHFPVLYGHALSLSLMFPRVLKH